MTRAIKVLVLLIVLAGVFLLFRALFPSEETVIRNLIRDLGASVSFSERGSPITQAFYHSELSGYFTKDVVVNVDLGRRETRALSGRDDLLQAAVGARMMLNSLQVKLFDIHPELSADKRTATADLTAVADADGEKNAYVQELRMVLRKNEEGEWRIHEVTTIRALRRP